MLTVILTVIGIASLTTTSMDIRMAGGERMRDTSLNAAEACLNSGAQILQQAKGNAGFIPAAMLVAGSNPVITPNPLDSEIRGTTGFENFPDSADPAVVGNTPNAVLTLPGFTITMDIDRLYHRYIPACDIPTKGVDCVEVLYRIDCYAFNAVTQTTGRVTGVYACVGEICLKPIPN
jgi:hypothetical protein